MSTTSISEAEIIQSSESFQALLNNPPHAQQPALVALVEWVVEIGFVLVGMIANLAKALSDQADEAFETARQASAQSVASAAAATISTAPPQRDTTPSPK